MYVNDTINQKVRNKIVLVHLHLIFAGVGVAAELEQPKSN